MTREVEIQARLDAATPGPWHATECEWECECNGEKLNNCDKDPSTCGEGRVIAGAMVPEVKTTDWGDYCDMNDTDAIFIANAPTDISYLLAENARLRAERDAARTDCAIAEKNHMDAVEELELTKKLYARHLPE